MGFFSKLLSGLKRSGEILEASKPMVKVAAPGSKADKAMDAASEVLDTVTSTVTVAGSEGSIKAKTPIVALVASLIAGKKIKDRKKFDSALGRLTKAADDIKASLE